MRVHDQHKIDFRDCGWIGRFWPKVAVGGPDECWPWTACVTHDGYGVLRIAGHNKRAHRLSYELHGGAIPQGMYVLHSCDNPPCCNPAHLRLGTQRDNGADMKARGRCSGNGYHTRIHSDGVVNAIRAAVASGEQQKIVAERFGVSRSYVSALITGRRRPITTPPSRSDS